MSPEPTNVNVRMADETVEIALPYPWGNRPWTRYRLPWPQEPTRRWVCRVLETRDRTVLMPNSSIPPDIYIVIGGVTLAEAIQRLSLEFCEGEASGEGKDSQPQLLLQAGRVIEEDDDE